MADWEDAPSSGGWEDAPATKHPLLKLKDEADTAITTADEAARFAGTGFLGGLVSGPLAVLKTLNDKASGRDSSVEANMNAIGSDLTYTPKTEGGIKAAEGISEFGNQILNPLLGHMGGFSSERYAPKRDVSPSVVDRIPKTDADRVLAKQAEIDAAKNIHEESLWESAPDRDPADPFGQMKQQLDTPQRLPAEPNPVIDSVAKGLQDQPMTAEQMNRGAEADKLAADRQAQLELETKRQATLDYNAAERARQENAGVPPITDPAALAPDVAPEHKLLYDDLLSEARKDEPTSGTPAFFREPDPMAPNPPVSSFNRRTRKQGGGVLLDNQPKLPEPQAKGESSTDFLKRVLSEDARSHVGRIGAPVIPNIPRGQRGAINPAVFKEGFEKLKQLADGTWLRAFSHGDSLTIEAIKDSKKVAGAIYEKTDKYAAPSETNLAATMVGSKQRGLATEIYKFASQLGNDIVPSKVRTSEGTALWDSFVRKGLATKDDTYIPRFRTDPNSYPKPVTDPFTRVKSPGNRQMGAIRIGENKQRQLEKLIPEQKNMIPKDPDAKEVVQEAYGDKDNNQLNYTEAGATLASMKRKSVAVLGASRFVQNAGKRADLNIRDNVLPVESAFRNLSRGELESVALLLKHESLTGKRLDLAALEQLSVKQQMAYTHMRAMLDDTMRIQNEARASQGKEPITAHEAYMSHRWEGDFRRPVFQTVLDKGGNPKIKPDGTLEKKLVWYLAADTKRGLEAQWQALKEKHPDLSYDPKEDHVVRFYKRETDLQSAYSTMVDLLGRDDPAVQVLKEAVEHQTLNEAASFLNQEKHFKEQTGVRGFVGDRPNKSGFSEALDFIQQQIQYAKNAYKWSEFQKSADSIKTIISDPKLIEEQPNNIKYIKEYWKNAIGYGEARAIAHLEDSIRELGVSPAIIRDAVGSAKTYFILNKLAVSTGYALANVVQLTNTLPHMVDQFAKGYHGNPITSVAVGVPAGIAMATGHYLAFINQTARNNVTKFSAPEANFLLKAFKYAEDNGVTARSIYDEAPVSSSFSMAGRAANILGKTVSAPEVMVRAVSYMTFVQFLRESGKFKGNDMALFQKAEELVNVSMVDYRATERPMAYAKLGTTGDFLSTLQTYPMNWYNQWNYMGREAFRGNPLPVMALFATQFAVAGIMGIPGYNDARKLYDFVKDHVISDPMYVKLRESEFWSDPHLWMLKHFGQPAVYGVLEDKTNLGLTSRVNAPGLGEMIQAPGGPIADIVKQGIQVGDALLHPTDTTKAAQAAMSVVPPGVQGLLEQAPFMEGKTFETRSVDGGPPQRVYQRPGNIEDHKGVYVRTPTDEKIRNFGMRSQQEVVGRELGYRSDQDTKTAERRANSIPNAFYDAVRRGDQSKAKELYMTYVKLTGNGISDDAIEKQLFDSYTTTMEKSAIAARSITALQNVARSRAIIESIKKEAGK
jgi:hypothetical protein